MEVLQRLLFGVRRSVRYHSLRRGFFEHLQKITSLVSVIFGSAAMVTVITNAGNSIIIASALIVTILSTIDLVIGTSTKAREHSDLRRRFIELEKEIVGVKNPTDDQIRAWTQKRLIVEADEPPVLKVLDSICHNDQMRAEGYDPKNFLVIKWYQRLFAQIIDISDHNIKADI